MSYNYDVIFKSEEKATNALENMRTIAKDFGKVTLADLYDIGDVMSSYTDTKKWWTETMLRFAKIEHYVGGWAIELPAPIEDRSSAKVTYRDYGVKKPDPKPEPLTITVNTCEVDDFDSVIVEVFKNVHAITDRPVYISII